MVVMRMPMVARISWLGSPMQHKHSRLMNSLHQSGNLSKKALALFLSMRPLSERVASSFIVTVKEREREREKEKWQQWVYGCLQHYVDIDDRGRQHTRECHTNTKTNNNNNKNELPWLLSLVRM
jgi:hypothetical protein